MTYMSVFNGDILLPHTYSWSHGCCPNTALWGWSHRAVTSAHEVVVSVNAVAWLLTLYNYTEEHEIPAVTITAFNTVDIHKTECTVFMLKIEV